MKDLQDTKNIISLIARLQNLCEGFDETNKSAVITSKIKILLELSKSEKVSPNQLKQKVGLAKSNITILCGKLISDGLMTKTRDTFDTREIYYSITDTGTEYLEKFLRKAKKNFESELAYKNNIKQANLAINDLLNLVE